MPDDLDCIMHHFYCELAPFCLLLMCILPWYFVVSYRDDNEMLMLSYYVIVFFVLSC